MADFYNDVGLPSRLRATPCEKSHLDEIGINTAKFRSQVIPVQGKATT
jgi:hypothetical protein